LLGPDGALGLRWLGLAVVPLLLLLAGFSLGREVRNAPRTSPSCAIAATATPKAHRQTSPKTMTLIRIAESPFIAHR